MPAVLVEEDMFKMLITRVIAEQGVPMMLRMGDTVLVDGLGEVYTDPTLYRLSLGADVPADRMAEDMDFMPFADAEDACND